MKLKRGGARPGAGRKKTAAPTKVMRLEIPLALALEHAIAHYPISEIVEAIGALDTLFDSCNKNQTALDREQPNDIDSCNRNQSEGANAVTASVLDSCNKNQIEENPLNSDQQKSVEVLLDWFKGKKKSAALSGAAGTGKTFLVGYFVKELRKDENVSPIFVVPTHKAKKQLQRSLSNSGMGGSECYTIAQALGKQPIVNRDGTEGFDKENSSLIAGADLVICDEASMVSAEDYQEIIDSVKKVLWMGDRYQLPPVGEALSPAFAKTPINVELRQVMRYSGHILNECQKLREAVDTNSIYWPQADELAVITVSSSEAFEIAGNLFASTDFSENSNFCRLLAFRNKEVDFFNRNIKRFVYGHSKEFFKSQKLIATRPVIRLVLDPKYGVQKMIVATNSEEMEIVSEPFKRAITSEDLSLAPDICQKLRGTMTLFKCTPESGNKFEARILHENAIKSKQAIFNEARRKGNKKAMAFLHAWGDSLKDIFALTVHKSQGSTFNYVFVHIEDILKQPSKKQFDEKDQRPELLYTAFSRASEKVYIIQSPF
ncbi:MAG: AAA family ATPase [Oscillatoria sp. SIO1A7]|nr:AAA family ATPase [Oscillatoria sp. SIO1A7]